MNPIDRTTDKTRDDLASLLAEIERHETIVSTWDAPAREAALAYREACDAVDGEALRRLVRELERDADAKASQTVLSDAFVCAALRRHGIALAAAAGTPDPHDVAPKTPGTTAEAEAKDGWFAAGPLSIVPEGGIKALTLGGEKVILFRDGAAVSCFENACAHFGLPLDRGSIKNGVITCPHHAFRFDLATGACRSSPMLALRRHEVRVVDDRVEVKLTPA